MAKEEAINKLAHIIFDAAKGGYIPFNVDGKHCAMSVARAKINEFLSPSSDTTELLMLNLDNAAEVDFERELGKYVSEGIHRFYPNESDDYYNMDSVVWQDYVIETAEHFYELGLKAQKGE